MDRDATPSAPGETRPDLRRAVTIGAGAGAVTVSGRFTLAPLAGVTDLPFRLLCKEFGAAMMTTEMVSAEALARGCGKTAEYIRFDDRERPIAVQLCGSDPARVAEAARIAVDSVGPEFIDLNFGCPRVLGLVATPGYTRRVLC